MELYIKLLSLKKFLNLYNENKFLRRVLVYKDSNVYYIEAIKNELIELERLLNSKGIKYTIKK